MTGRERRSAYMAQTGRASFTPRQLRRLRHKQNRDEKRAITTLREGKQP